MIHETLSPDILATPSPEELQDLREQHQADQAEAAKQQEREAFNDAVNAELSEGQRSLHERMAELQDPDNDDPFKAGKLLQLQRDLQEAQERPLSGPTPVYKGRGKVVAQDSDGKRITAGQLAEFSEAVGETPEKVRQEADVNPNDEIAAMEGEHGKWLGELYNAERQEKAAGRTPNLGLTPEEEKVYQSYSDRRILATERQERVKAGDVHTRSEAIDHLKHVEAQHGADSDEAALALANVSKHLAPKQYVAFREHGKRETELRERLEAMSPREVVEMSPEEAERIFAKYPHLAKGLEEKSQIGARQVVREIMSTPYTEFREQPVAQQQATLDWLERNAPDAYQNMMGRARAFVVQSASQTRPEGIPVPGRPRPVRPIVDPRRGGSPYPYDQHVAGPGLGFGDADSALPPRIDLFPGYGPDPGSQPAAPTPSAAPASPSLQDELLRPSGRPAPERRRRGLRVRAAMAAGATVFAALTAGAYELGGAIADHEEAHRPQPNAASASRPGHKHHKPGDKMAVPQKKRGNGHDRHQTKTEQQTDQSATGEAAILGPWDAQTGAGTIWNLAANDLRSHGFALTPEGIQRRTDEILRANHLSNEEARHLSDDANITIPPIHQAGQSRR